MPNCCQLTSKLPPLLDSVEGRDPPIAVCPHKSLNSYRGVISETDLLCASEAEILEGLADQEARKLIVPLLSQTYAQVTKTSPISISTQTDPNIANLICPPLQYLKPLSSNQMPITTTVPVVSTSSSSTQAQLLPSTSSIAATVSKPLSPIPISNDLLFTTYNMFTPIESSL
ncbi:hypothetical protein TNCV_2600221 [Trichonephila clavipes]|nr:hypothetical protein TNCV_2600221 [Trichonephila clavipes]